MMSGSDLPLVSTIIPAYNCALTVKTTLESIAKQTYSNVEIIVVFDGGSTDNTLEILVQLKSELVVKGTRMRILKTPHIGRSAARNAGWKATKGEILFFADSDEMYKEEYVSLGVQELLSNPIEGVTITGSSWATESSLIGRLYTDVYSPLQRRKEREGSADLNWAWMFKRDAVHSVSGYDESLDQAEDRDMYIRMKDRGFRFNVIYGEHWHHRRPSTLRAYLSKTWAGARNRVKFSLKHRRYREIGLNLVPTLALAIVISSIFISRFLFTITFLISIIFTAAILLSGYRRISFVPERKLVFLFLLLQLLTRVLTSVGSLYGLTLNTIKRSKKVSPETKISMVEV